MTETHITESPLQRVLGRLERVSGNKALCPAHDDRNPSLSVNEGEDGCVLVNCHAGCSLEEILSALGLEKRDLFPTKDRPQWSGGGGGGRGKLTATFEIRDRRGNLKAYHLRYDKPNGDKECKWKRPDGSLGLNGTPLKDMPLYGEELVDDWPDGAGVVLVEGEPAKDALEAAGIKALGTVTGAKVTPTPSTLDVLEGRVVCLWPDNDSAGRTHMERIAQNLQGIAKEVRWFEWQEAPEKGDAADHPAVVTHEPEALTTLRRQMAVAPVWKAPKDTVLTSKDTQDEVGVTKRLADAILAQDHFAQDVGGKLYRFQGGSYRQFGERYIKMRVKQLLEEWCETKKWSSHRASEVAEYIRADAPVLWESPPLDEVNLKNGILNVSTRHLRDHDPAFLSTVQMPVDYDPEATCYEWDKFVATTFPGDAQALAYELAADLMTPERSEQKSVLLIGEGSNGKSTYLAALSNFIGSTNIVGLSLQKMESDRFSSSRLLGKLANICPDLPSSHLVGTSMFKAVTGGDAINAEYKYRESFEFRPFARLVFSANQVPRSEDATHAFFRRWLVVPFDRTFEGGEQIPREELDAKLSDPRELSGVLNKALDSLPSLRRNGFTESAKMKEAWEEFRAMTDPVSVWLDKHTIEHSDAYVSRDELWQNYNEHTEHAKLTKKAFSQALKRTRPHIGERQVTISGRRVWCWIGIALQSSEPDPPDQGPGTYYKRVGAQGAQHAQDSTNCFLNDVGIDNTGEKEERHTEITNKGKPVHPVHDVQGKTPSVDAALDAMRHGNGPRKVVENILEGKQKLPDLAKSVMYYHGAKHSDGWEAWLEPVTEAFDRFTTEEDEVVGGAA